MSTLNPSQLPHAIRQQIFEALRLGTVPDNGLESFACLDADVAGALDEWLAAPSDAGGIARFVRGDYGAGKTFCVKLLADRARRAGFATAFAMLDARQIALESPERLLRAWVSSLRVDDVAGGALVDLIDRWAGRVEANVAAQGAAATVTRTVPPDVLYMALQHDLVRREIGVERPDVRTALLAMVTARNAGDFERLWALASWLGGSDNVAPAIVREAGLRGRITAEDAEYVLADVVRLTRAAGLEGVVFAIDEVAAVLRAERGTRERCWERVLHIVERWRLWPHTVWVFAATDEVFDHPRGVVGFEALHQRVGWVETGGVASARQVQLRLQPIDAPRLAAITERLADIYPAALPWPERVKAPGAADRLVSRIVGGDAVRPRRFLRQLCDVFDALDTGRVASLDEVVAPLTPEDEADDAAVPVDDDDRGPLKPAPITW